MSPDLEAVEREWSRRGFTFGVWVDQPGQRWDDFVHEDDELFMVIEGSVELEMGGDPRRPVIGEEVLIPANATHSVRNVGEGVARWLYGYKRDSDAG